MMSWLWTVPRGADQVAVFITSLGKTYKIFDQPLSYP